MGDSRIRICISKALINRNHSAGDNEHDSIDFSTTQTYSADTTIREVAESVGPLWALFTSGKRNFDLWDCTFHPPKVITDWPTEKYPELTGPRSKTLHDAGLFPSGTWMALPLDSHPRDASIAEYDDVQFSSHISGRPQADHSQGVQFKDPELSSSKPLPSQVMQSVGRRFGTETDPKTQDTVEAKATRLQNQEQQKKRQQERAAKLDQRILHLEEQSSEKNKKVSDQVRRMLIKSRATGDKKLKVQDRLYFECILDSGSHLEKEFRYFSPQDTFAKISSTFPLPKGLSRQEVVVRWPREGSVREYRRFHVAMRIYEAMAENLLTGQIDTLVIRCYADGDDATPSFDEVSDQMETEDLRGGSTPASNEVEAPTAMSLERTEMDPNKMTAEEDSTSDSALATAIKKMDEKLNKGKKPKKKSAAATKVRNMQIKSKAKGDSKRIPKLENRFFLEVIVVDVNDVATSTFQFWAQSDPMERLLQSVPSQSTEPRAWDFLVPVDTESFYRIPDTSMCLSEVEAKGILKCYDRIIPRPK